MGPTRAAKSYDVIVLGVGAMGSAACWQLARRGARVLGLEQQRLGHDRGSSHGETRLIRQAYFEHPAYVPLLRRAYALWREAEQAAGTALMRLNGLVVFGPMQGGSILPGVRVSGEAYAVPIEELSGAQAAARYPSLVGTGGMAAILEPGAGYLTVERAVLTLADLARRHGAEVREEEPVRAVREHEAGVEVTTPTGVYQADELVVTAGAWSPRWLPELAPQLAVHRVLLHWFRAGPAWDVERGLPCFGFELEPGFFYGLPAVSARGVKVGLHVPGELVERPEELRRTVRPDEADAVRAFVRAHLAGVDPEPLGHAACMYTMTQDEHFILGRQGRTSFAAGFSGHGFKFAPVIGEALADLATAGRTALPIEFLAPRPARRGPPHEGGRDA